MNTGVIYVLTNPSFPEYVKIGYADNVETRLNQLNRSECTPFAFRIYATLNVANRLADKNIHKLIDKFKPELRSKENINGKMRIREFFAMSAKEAYDLLLDIGGIYGETPCLYTQTSTDVKDEEIAISNKVAAERRSPFSFYKCGINNGEELIYVNDSKITCKVIGDRDIIFDGKKTSLSALAKKLLQSSHSVQGTLYFTYQGEILSALRKRLEDAGSYLQNSEQPILLQTQMSDNDDLLYFVMAKYDAKCKQVNNAFLLLKGSHIAPTLSKSCRNSIKKMRAFYAQNISNDFVVTDDIMFDSSSTVASFVGGMSLNGKIYWKTKDGVLLKTLEDK